MNLIIFALVQILIGAVPSNFPLFLAAMCCVTFFLLPAQDANSIKSGSESVVQCEGGAWLVGDNNNNQQAQVGWTRGLGRGRQTPERVQRENLTIKRASERDENEKHVLIDGCRRWAG